MKYTPNGLKLETSKFCYLNAGNENANKVAESSNVNETKDAMPSDEELHAKFANYNKDLEARITRGELTNEEADNVRRSLVDRMKELGETNFNEPDIKAHFDQALSKEVEKSGVTKLPESVLALEKEYGGFEKIPGQAFLDRSKVSKEDLQATFLEQEGASFSVDFKGNDSAYRAIGVADLMEESKTTYAKINGRIGKLTISSIYGMDKVGYEDENGNYLGIQTGGTIETGIAESDIASFEAKAKETGWGFETLDLSDPAVIAKMEAARDSFSEGFERKDELMARLKEKSEALAKADFDTYTRDGLGFEDFEMDHTPATQAELRSSYAEVSNINPNLTFEMAQEFFEAISSQESNGNYLALGAPVNNSTYNGARAIGRFQIMPPNWYSWAGNKPPTARNQDMVAFKQNTKHLSKWMNRGNNFEDAVKLAAVQWYGNNGERLAKVEDISKRGDATLGYSPDKYAKSILNKTIS